MIEYQNINANESGLVVRAKLNNMFKALISSKEGVNRLWKSIAELDTKTGEVQQDSDDKYQELKEQLLKSFDYTDKTADDLLVYINGINGGVSGFAVDPTFKPEFPIDVAATVLAAGAGTYVNFLDSNGQAITITESNAITIFYKAKGVTFWQYKSIYASVTTDASKVMYNNETSGLEAGNVQEAIDGIAKKTSTFAGIATPTTNPGTPDGSVFYFANQDGTYTNFNGIKLSLGESAILKYNNGTWEKEIFPDTSSYADNDHTKMENATTYVLTHNGDAIKPMTTFDAVFDAGGKSLTDIVGNMGDLEVEGEDIVEAINNAAMSGSGSGGMNPEAIALLNTILGECVFTSDQRTNINKLIESLGKGGGGGPFVYTPEISIAGGVLNITCKSRLAEIHYTTNGQDPTASSPKFTTEVQLTQSCTVKAIAFKGEGQSMIAEKYYDKDKIVKKPTITISNFVISMAADSGTTIYYTLDGSTPSTSSLIYDEPFTHNMNCTIKAIAIDADGDSSALSTAEYAAKVVIKFRDSAVKTQLLLIAGLDADNDGELTAAEVSKISSFGGYPAGKFYNNKDIEYFDEFEYFTGFNKVEWDFNGCSNLKSIKLPATVTSLGQSAFSGCSSLEHLDLSNVKSIGFASLPKGLVEVDLRHVTTWNNSAGFQGFSKLVTAKLPENATWFPNCYGCVNLESINIPNGVTSLNDFSTFTQCSKLIIGSIPDSVTSLGFDSSNLPTQNIKILNTEQVVTCVRNNVITQNGQYHIGYYVPDALYEDYKVAENWSTLYSKGKLFKLSEYPTK